MSTILRELALKLGLDVDAQSFAKGELAAKLVEKGIEKLVDIAHEAAEAFAENVKEVIEYGDELNKASQASGIARDALQELRYAANLADVSNEEFTASINVLTRTMRAAKDGSEEQGKAFKKLGIHVTDAKGKLRGADDVMSDVAEHLSKMPDGAEKTALAMQFFGRAGAKMIPILNEGADGLAEMRQEARDLGLVMDDEAVKASEELNDNLTRLKMIGQGLWRQAIGPLIPAMNRLVERFLKWRKENAIILGQKIRQYVGYLIKAVEALADALGFVIKNMTMIKILAASVAAAWIAMNASLVASSVAAAATTAAAWLVAAAPFVAIGAAIAAMLLIFDDLRVYAKGGDSLFGRWEKALKRWSSSSENDPWWLKAIKDTVQGLTDAIALLREWGDTWDRVMGRANDAISNPNIAKSTSPEWKKKRVAAIYAANAMPDSRIAAPEFGPEPEQPFGNLTSPQSATLPPGGGVLRAPVTQVNQRTYKIYQSPGMSPQDVADAIQRHEDAANEAAAAALGD